MLHFSKYLFKREDGVLMAGQHDTLFELDRYNQAKMTDRKTAIANAIVNACFMVPGNLPSSPTTGVNIRQYFYKEETAISADKIRADLETACGKLILGAVLGNVDFSVQKTTTGDTVFLLIVRIKFSATEEELLGITMKETSNNYVKFNFDYINMGD